MTTETKIEIETVTATVDTAPPAPTVYPVPAHRLGLFEERFAALQRRARRLGCPEPTYTVGDLYTITRRVEDLDGEAFLEFVEVYPVTVAGAAPRFEGWSFLAVVDYEAAAPIFRKTPAAGDRDLPDRFRTMGPVCEHCLAHRGRKETFIVEHQDGRTVQVGRQCIRDFLGGNTPENIAALAAYESDVHAACGGEDGGFMGEPPFVPEIGAYLSWVVRSINLWGWISRSAARDNDECGGGQPSTATTARGSFERYVKACKEGRADRAQKPTEQEKARAAEVLAWARALGEGSDRKLSDYEHNLKAACGLGLVSHKHMGLVASAVAAFDREAARRKAIVSEHVGTVGERLRDVRVFVDKVRGLEDNAYGTCIVLLRDGAGRQFKWFTTNVPDTGKEYAMTATVKGHGERNGVLQTIVTRAELQADDEPTKAEKRHAETVDVLLHDVALTLHRAPFGWQGYQAFAARRVEAFETTNVTDLSALRAELAAIAAEITPAEEPVTAADRAYLSFALRGVRARLAPASTKKVKPADRATATLLAKRLGKAADAGGQWPHSNLVERALHELLPAIALDLPALREVAAEYRAYVADRPAPERDGQPYFPDKAAESTAGALALLDAPLSTAAKPNPAAAARLHKGIGDALALAERWPFVWREEACALRERADAALDQGDAVAMEAIRAELVAAVPSLPVDPAWTKGTAAHDPSYRDEGLERCRAAVLAEIMPKTKKAAVATESAPASA